MAEKRSLILGATAMALIAVFGVGCGPPMHGGSETADELRVPDPEFVFQPAPEMSAPDMVRLFTDDEYLTGFIRSYGPETATNKISEAQEHVDIDCHQRAHDVGRIAFDLYGVQAFAVAGHTCHAGAMHGVTEGVLLERGTDDLAYDVQALCESAQGAFFRHQCVHGVGHGLMAWIKYELPQALDLCDRLTEEEDRTSCYSGVFMENVDGSLSGAMVHPSDYLREDDAHFPCNALENRYVGPCYFFQTSHMYKVFGGDFGAIARECATVPELAQRACFRSMGRDVGWHLQGQPAAAIGMCSLATATSHRLACLEETVLTWFWEIAGAESALEFCGLLDDHDEALTCYWTIALQGTELYETANDFWAFCRRFEDGYIGVCEVVLSEAATGPAL